MTRATPAIDESVGEGLIHRRGLGLKRVVEWQSSHAFDVWMWFDGLPVAVVPLWQLEHDPVIEL